VERGSVDLKTVRAAGHVGARLTQRPGATLWHWPMSGSSRRTVDGSAWAHRRGQRGVKSCSRTMAKGAANGRGWGGLVGTGRLGILATPTNGHAGDWGRIRSLADRRVPAAQSGSGGNRSSLLTGPAH
jgi:hypothetical protein